MDSILIMKGDAEPSLWDWKTSQAYQSWWRLQGAAYRNLAKVDRDIVTPRGGSVRLKKDGSGCLVDEWPQDYRKDFNTFLGLVNAHNFFNPKK